MPNAEAILGLSAFYHDSAAALIRDGEIVAAAQEERFTRVKHDSRFPQNAVQYCLKEAGLKVQDLKAVVFYDKPFDKFHRILENYFAVAPKGLRAFIEAMTTWSKDKLWIRGQIDRDLGHYEGELLFCRHHESHAASAFYPSPYDRAAILTIDGVGEWHTTTWGTGHGRELKLVQKIDYPHSLGLLYSAMTYYTGFKINSGEYKVMGLAPYGQPRFAQIILDHLIDLRDDGSFALNMEYFAYMSDLKMINSKFEKLFGGPARSPESELTQREMDLACSIQEVINLAVLRLGRYIRKTSGEKKLCLAGGVALNCVANGLLMKERVFEHLWIQPAAGDAGGALGSALFAWHQLYGQPRPLRADGKDRQKASRLGPAYSLKEMKSELQGSGAVWEEVPLGDLYSRVAEHLANEAVVGWFQGRMEFGPRALGGRSILGDPRSKNMQSTMNLKIKYRESFRPFAPSVLEEKMRDCFELEQESPYMLLVSPVASHRQLPMSADQEKLFGIDKLNIPRSDLPSITHIDYSARVQTVHPQTSPEYHSLIQAFYDKTGCPCVINTSFNVRGEPIVCTPKEAYQCFMRTEMDVLVIENAIFIKTHQPALKQDSDWRSEFELD